MKQVSLQPNSSALAIVVLLATTCPGEHQLYLSSMLGLERLRQQCPFLLLSSTKMPRSSWLPPLWTRSGHFPAIIFSDASTNGWIDLFETAFGSASGAPYRGKPSLPAPRDANATIAS